ncbi:MAG: hypothetical protein IIA33_06570, partial [Planctomycetes bacterium]|nr:hypothetical protein [Planctomycetota bacterium]
MKRNAQLLIAYDGTDFHGWQTQAALRTVQTTIQEVAQRVVRHPVTLIASGRTDAGVHASGQIANFHPTPGRIAMVDVFAEPLSERFAIRTVHRRESFFTTDVDHRRLHEIFRRGAGGVDHVPGEIPFPLLLYVARHAGR